MMSHRRKNCDQERDVIWNKISQMETENKEIKNKNKVLEAENKELARQLQIVYASVAKLEERDVGMKEVLERVLCRLESIDEAMAEGEVPSFIPKPILKTPEVPKSVDRNGEPDCPDNECLMNGTGTIKKLNFADECVVDQSTPMHASVNGNVTDCKAVPFGMNNSMRVDIQPDTFNGDGMSLDDYLCHFSSITTCNGWTDKIAGVHFAACMRGKALSLLNELSLPDRHSLSVAVNHLKKRYYPEGKESYFATLFNNRKKLATETPTEYATSLRALSRKAYPSLDVIARENLIKQRFISGFPDFEMCKTLTIRQTQSLDELITVADVCHSIDATHSVPGCNRASKPMVAVVNNSERDDGVCESEFSKLRNDIKEMLDSFRAMIDKGHQPRFSRQKGGRRNEGITCYGCGAKGHIRRNCPENQCQRCHGRGHTASQCDRYYVPQNSQPSAYSAQQTVSGPVGNFSPGNSSNSAWGGNGQTPRDGGNIPQFHPSPKNNDMPLNRNQ
uniref:uncharacterized protein LOC120329442 n=1 Tax=Styela clava TaxID=7725 RepID=UPI00193A7E0C|nr:uncharacterized protein LOC120329442 [Styela clava]